MNESIDRWNRVLDEHLPPACKRIFVINVAVFLVFFFLSIFARTAAGWLITLLGQAPLLSIKRLYLWQFVTYMFVHVDVLHILFNMFCFWMFAPPLEMRMGTRAFWRFYLTTGIGAGILQAVLSLQFGQHGGQMNTVIIGASGAIFGVLLGYAAYYPNQMILFFMVYPMKAKYFMIVIALLEFYQSALSRVGGDDHISHLTHFTGAVVAYAWLAWHHRDWDIRHWQWSH